MLGMVEKVARAICRSMLQDPDIDYEVHHQDGLVKGWKMYESEARAAIEAMQVMWQPISTAPKNTIILCFGKVAGEVDGPYDENHVFPAIYDEEDPGGDFPGYDWTIPGTDYHAMWMKPTHWIPIPPKPEAE